ncbi:MAG: ABC transporter ATP-binding protein [Gemmatimonadetes bacterium]|nr:ABC transporter ATP-binding protein [Gemmatimonadota bacterium]
MNRPTRIADGSLWGMLRLYWGLARARPSELAIPAFLVFVGGAFDALTFGLLIPLTHAVAEGGFGFLESSMAFGWLGRLVPAGGDAGFRDRALLIVILGLIVAGRIAVLTTEYVRNVWVAARNERYRVRVGESTFRRVLGFGRQYFNRRSMGELDAEIGWAAAAPELLNLAEGLFQRAIRFLVKLTVMVALSVPLTLVFVLTIPLVLLLLRRVRRFAQAVAEETAGVERKVRREVLDLLYTMPLVKAFSREERAARTHSEILRSAQGLAVRRERSVGLRWPLSEIIILVTMIGVQGAMILVAGDFVPGELGRFAAFLLLLQQSFPDVNGLLAAGVSLSELMPKLDTVATLFSDEGKEVVISGPHQFEGLQREIRVRGLSFSHTPGVPVLQGVDATIPARMVTAIVGASGSGKTTFVDLIARLYECPRGTILMDGRDVHEFSIPSLHRRMALVSQDNWLLNRSLRENLCFGLESSPGDDQLLDLLEGLALEDLLARLPAGLDTEVGDRGVRLSGGQRQRIDIARALLCKPDVMILDEATSALDSVVERRVIETVQERLAGSTVILIAHRLSTVRVADLILVMRDGRIVEGGTWGELLQREGAFFELHRAQFGRTGSPAG